MPVRYLFIACLSLAAFACGERSPVAPVGQPGTPLSPSPSPAPIVPQTTGIVRDSRGAPVAGAAISFRPDTGQQLISNEAGEFALPPVQAELVVASKPGFESAIVAVSSRVELTLHDIIRVPALESEHETRVIVGPGDSLGGRAFQYRIRTIRVFAGGDRTVRIRVVADDGGPVDYRVEDGCGDLCPESPATFSLPGGAEREVRIQIPHDSTVRRTFTVTTSAVDTRRVQHLGFVRDSRGNPIAGAAISFWPDSGDKRFSDASGQFEVPFGLFETVHADKPGHESATDYLADRVTLTLHDIIRIPVGQSARVVLGPGESLGGPGLRYRIRRVRVSSASDTRVRIQILADDGGPVDYRVAFNCGDVCPVNPSTFFIEAGGERQVEIQQLSTALATRTYTVATAEDP